MKNIFVAFFAVLVILFVINSNNLVKESQEVTLKIPYSALTNKAKQQVECLTQNIYFEANNESEEGQLAVAMVTMKRTKSSSFPNNVCGVVRQKTNNTCQFSWWCDSKLKEKAIANSYNRIEKEKLNKIRKVAMQAYLNYEHIEDPTHGAMFYHASYVNPKWNLKKTVAIGQHIFYRRS
jgi:spore germination cell wall hydrolase CwlJ-like protein